MLVKSLAALALLALAAAFAPQAASAQTVLFEGARIIPGDGGPVLENGALLVENGMIALVGPNGSFAPPAPAQRINLTGKTIMPAIVSPHVHPGFQRGTTYKAENFNRETIVDDLNRALYFGVSTVMSLGVETGDVMFKIREDQREGRLGGAQLYLAGRGMGAPNAGPGNPIYANFAYSVSTEEQARQAVREQAARGIDIFKIWVDDRGGRAPKLPMNIARAAIYEGHKAGLKVAAHIFYHEDALALSESGINLFAHLVRDKVMSGELIASMIQHNVYVMPNLGAPERGGYDGIPAWLEEPNLNGLLAATVTPDVIANMRKPFAGRDPAVTARNRANYNILKQSVARLAAAGAAIVLGPDTGLEDNFFGYTEHRELQLMNEAGMSPAQIIVAATGRAAQFMGLGDRGVLAPGKRADVLVLDANPLDDIRNTRRIAKLYLAGTEVDRAKLAAGLKHP
jgi:imidazolonepropionase-like amidohydrolase